MTESLTHYDHFIHQEMLAHPVLFTHPKAKHIAILDNQYGTVQEAIKHASLEEIWQVTPCLPADLTNDTRFKIFTGDAHAWLAQVSKASLDVIIAAEKTPELAENIYKQYLNALKDDGIFVQKCASLFELPQLKSIYQILLSAGFNDIQILHFPQPGFPTGWRTAMMAIKHGAFKRVREKDIFNKPFTTQYYNYDVHKAALVMPEFMRNEFAV